nr:carboxypeptidase-like regulatory domain-containing protein [Pyrinomonadaceae bacterium]
SNSVFTGNAAANGGAMNNAASTGPAVAANLTLVNCLFTNNSSTSSGMALQNFSTSFLNVRNSTISNNTTTATGIAGAIQANGTVTITNSTVSGNTASAGTGAGVYFNGTSLNMTSTTIVGNSSGVGGGGLHRTGTNSLIIRNTIIAGNNGVAASPDAFGPVNSEGNNIIGNVLGSTGWVAADLQNTNPILAPLGNYGGIGLTHSLLSMSPALNGGQNCVIDLSCAANNPPVAIATDQRGATRANVDIGAFEESSSYRAVLPVAVNNQSYSQILTSNIGSFTYTQSGGSLPIGITVNTGGIIANVSGTPTQAGVFDFGVNIAGANSALVNYRLYVSPSTTSVFGRIVSPNGAFSSKVTVLLTSNSGNTIRTTTNPFGYYRFDNVNVGQVYQVTAASKIFTFVNNSQFVLVNDAVTAPDITIAP